MATRKEFVSNSWVHLLPDAELEICEENLQMFWYWIYERQNIYHRRFVEGKKAPWTKDPILRDYKFCNVYRELDRNSIWIINNVIKSNKFKDDKDRLFAMIVCRLFNRPETFMECGIPDYYNFNPKLFRLKIEKKVVNKGESPFTDAYLVNSVAYGGLKKYVAYAEHVCKQVHDLIPDFLEVIKNSKNPKQIINSFKKINGVSDFVAYELYCDLTYWDGVMKWDLNDYVNTGPGCRVGIRLLFPKFSFNNEDTNEMMHYLRDNQDAYLKKYGFKDYKHLNNKYGKLTLREIEHSLCELQKYFKMKHGVGKPRMKFKPIAK